MHRALTITAMTCILLACGVTLALAEVAAKTDRFGNYLTTQVIALGSPDDPQIWTVRGHGGRHARPLNPDGDLNGDLAPTIAEGPLAPFHPWVVWSRWNGASYDLAWSNWTADGWGPVDWVGATASGGDEMDPLVGFDSTGRPYLVWWSEEQGRGTVFLSMFLATRWMSPLRVSGPETDARYPVVTLVSDNIVDVSYLTPDGPEAARFGINMPVTITDDIDPLSFTCTAPPGDPTPRCLP